MNLLSNPILALAASLLLLSAAASPSPLTDTNKVPCGQFGQTQFTTTVGPFSAGGWHPTSGARAREIAIRGVAKIAADAAFADFVAQGLPLPDCNKDQECPHPLPGCNPAVRFTDISNDFTLVLEGPFETPLGWFCRATVTIVANADAESGCGPCPTIEA